MELLSDITELINYGLVTVYGFLLSVAFSGGCKDTRQRRMSTWLLAFFVLVQLPFHYFMGTEFTKKIYPVLVHLPLVLILVLAQKKSFGIALVSVCTAYSCCQFPRWISIAVLDITHMPLAANLSYTISIVPIFLMLYYFFSKFAYTAMSYSHRSLVLFGIMPISYYIFDYATAIYTKLLYSGGFMIAEAMPTICILFYVGFISMYHAEVQRRNRTEFEKSALSMELKQAETEIDVMKMIHEQNAVLRHDLRHHLNMISNYLENNDGDSALAYINQIKDEADKVKSIIYTDNKIVNFALSYYAFKAKQLGIRVHYSANVPQKTAIADTDLSALLSNVLENALNAAASCADPDKREINALITEKNDKLLISVTNSYEGNIVSENGVPSSGENGHGFGVKSIRSIAHRYDGECLFEWSGGEFRTRIVMNM